MSGNILVTVQRWERTAPKVSRRIDRLSLQPWLERKHRCLECNKPIAPTTNWCRQHINRRSVEC